MFNSLKKVVSQNKIASGVGAVALSTASQAAVTFDPVTQSFAGSFDLTPYYTAIGIIVVAIAIIAGIKLGLRGFSQVR